MRRFAFHFATALSLILLIASIVAWALSYARFDMLGAETAIHEGRQIGGTLESRVGSLQLTLWRRRYLQPPSTRLDGGFDHMAQPYMTGGWISRLGATKLWGFSFSRVQQIQGARINSDGSLRNDPPQMVWLITVPHWALVLVTGMLPLIWLIRNRRSARQRRRIAAGLCPKCGYDLRASEGRCPECGAAVQLAG